MPLDSILSKYAEQDAGGTEAPRPPVAPAGVDPLLAKYAEPEAPRPARPRARVVPPPVPAVSPQLDSFVNDVIGEAAQRTGYTYKLGSGGRTPAEQAEKVAEGLSRTYNSKHLTGRGRDVLAYDEQGRYITDGAHPAYKALGDVLHERGDVSVRWGGDFKSFYDPSHFELMDEQAGTLDPILQRHAEPVDPVLQKYAEPDDGGDVQPAHYVLNDQGAWTQTDESPDFRLPEQRIDPDEVVRVNASVSRTGPLPKEQPAPSLPQLPARPDPYTVEGRAVRDASAQAEQRPDARTVMDLTLPEGWESWDRATSHDIARAALWQAAQARGIPAEYVSEWLVQHGADLKAYDLKTQRPISGADAIASPDYDPQRKTIRIHQETPDLLRLQRDYEAQRAQLDRAQDWYDDPTRTAGEKALDIAAPVVRGAGEAIARPFAALDAQFWSRVNRPGLVNKIAAVADPFDRPALGAAYSALVEGETPDDAKNPIAERVRRDVSVPGSVGALHPNLASAAAGATELLTSPSTYLAGGDLLKGGETLRSLPGARRVGALLSAPSDARFARGGRVLDIESVVREMKPADVLGVHGFEVKRIPAPNARPGMRAGEVWQVRAAGARRPMVFTSDGELKEFADSVAATAARPSIPRVPDSRSRLRRAGETALDLAAAPKSLMSAGDLSAAGRQGLILSLTEPRLALRAMGRQVKSLASQRSHDDLLRWLAAHPRAAQADAAGLYSALKANLRGGLAGREDAFVSRIAGRLPVVKQSERAYVAYLDSLRMDAFDKYARQFERAGLTFETHPEEFKSIARFINSATGRGELPKALEKFVPVLNATMFAPHNLKGRFDVLNPVFYARMSPVARKIAVKKMVQFVGTVTTGMYLAHLAGAKVTLNPNDPDFGKVVVGRTHYDFTSGHRAVVRLVAQLGQTFASAKSGELKDVLYKSGGLLLDFLRKNSAPVVNYGVAAATGKEITGEHFEKFGHLYRDGRFAPGGGVIDRTLFFSLQDIFDAWASEGGRGVAKAAPAAVFGVSVQTYEPKGRPRR